MQFLMLCYIIRSEQVNLLFVVFIRCLPLYGFVTFVTGRADFLVAVSAAGVCVRAMSHEAVQPIDSALGIENNLAFFAR